MGIVGILGAPPPSLLAFLAAAQDAPNHSLQRSLIVLGIVFGVALTAFIIFAILRELEKERTSSERKALEQKLTEDYERGQKAVAEIVTKMEARIKEAIKLQLETHNHSDEWYVEAARLRRDELFQHAAEIREREASRRLRGSRIEKEYHEAAGYAQDMYGHDAEEMQELLRKADEFQFRLLETAEKLAQSEQVHASDD